jgi:hypothetical protein
MRWNQALETGGLVVSDNVKIHLHIEAILNSEGIGWMMRLVLLSLRSAKMWAL